MQLQLAVDAPEHLALVPRLARYFDIIEAGTPVLKRFGLAAISTLLELSGGRPVLADTKTVDGGALEAEMVLGAGASYLTVLAHASPATREATEQVAAEHHAAVVFDMILDGGFDTSLLGAPVAGCQRWIGVHASSDMRRAGHGTDTHIAAVGALRAQGLRVSLAGGIRRDNLANALLTAPDVVVIGSGVTAAENPQEEAEWIRHLVDSTRG